MQQKPPRPTGVTVLAVLAILVGLGGLVIGAGLLIVSAAISTLNIAAYPQLQSAGLSSSTLALIFGVFGAVTLILGLLDLGVGIGFLGGKGWAWSLAMVVGVINIVFAIPSIYFFRFGSVVPLIVWIIIIYYLTRTRVKAFFGKAPWTPPSMGAPTMGGSTMTGMGSTSTGATMIRCASCGTMAPAGTMKCPSCGANL